MKNRVVTNVSFMYTNFRRLVNMEKVTLTFNGIKYEMPIIEGTEGEKGIDI